MRSWWKVLVEELEAGAAGASMRSWGKELEELEKLEELEELEERWRHSDSQGSDSLGQMSRVVCLILVGGRAGLMLLAFLVFF